MTSQKKIPNIVFVFALFPMHHPWLSACGNTKYSSR